MEAAERPVGFVNSYLDVSVEIGLPVLAVVLAVFVFLILLAARRRDFIASIAAGACLLAWGVANVWSSLWMEPLLWVCPAFAAILIIIRADKSVMPAALLRSVAVAGAVIILIWGAGWFSARSFEWLIIKDASSERVSLRKRENAGGANKTGAQVEIWADGAVFGAFYGRNIRAIAPWFPVSGAIVYPPWFAAGRNQEHTEQKGNLRIYSGFQAARVFDTSRGEGNVILLHPTMPPPRGSMAKIENSKLLLCLPEQDTSGYSLQWRRWAAAMNVRLVYSPQLGPRIVLRGNVDFWRRLFAGQNNGLF